MPVTPAVTFVISLQWAIALVGAVLLWIRVLSPAGRARREPARLAPWVTPLSDLMMFLWLVICGAILFPLLTQLLCNALALDIPTKTVVVNAAYHCGMLLGVAAHQKLFAFRLPAAESELSANPSSSAPAPLPLGAALREGALTLLMWMPIVLLAAFLWSTAMRAVGLPTESQNLVELFKTIKSPVLLGLMVLFASVIAPINEELIFRRGIFRYARTRLPRWGALLLPACLFSALHGHLSGFAPLAALGIAFSLAYERSGRLVSAIFAHALFNSYTVICLFIAPEAG